MRSFSLIFKQFSRSVLLLACFAVWGFSAQAQGDPANGEALFKSNNCNSCHKIDKKSTGPALGPIMASDNDDKWLTHWIQNNQALIAAKDAKALTIWNQFNQSNMPVFAALTDAQAGDIIAYVRADWKKMEAAAKAAPAAPVETDKGPSDLLILGLLAVIIVAFIVILVLNRVISTLERVVTKKAFLVEDEAEVAVVAVDRFAGIKKMAKNRSS